MLVGRHDMLQRGSALWAVSSASNHCAVFSRTRFSLSRGVRSPSLFLDKLKHVLPRAAQGSEPVECPANDSGPIVWRVVSRRWLLECLLRTSVRLPQVTRRFAGRRAEAGFSLPQTDEELAKIPCRTAPLRSRLSKCHLFSGRFQSRARKQAVSSNSASPSEVCPTG
jgi:hypothetical protein